MMKRLHTPLLAALLAFSASPLTASPPTAEELLRKKTSAALDSATLTDGDAFSKSLLASTEWQHELWDSGPAGQPQKTIRILHAIWKSDPGLADRPVDRRMATACALEAPRRSWTAAQTLPRYSYFRDKWKYGLLNNMYGNLSVFERRFLARGVQHTAFNTLESMEYQNQEVCLPAERYTGACWYARWILHNPFGDSIHGPLYYAPFHGSWDTYAEVVRKVGGVCGSLSNFGAAAALANGVPAATMGEPGHCSYAVMTRPGHWQPAYSLHWKRGMHTSFHSGSWGWHMLNTKAQQDIGATRDSADLRRLSTHYLENNDVRSARSTIAKARAAQPLDWQNWELSVHVLRRTKASAKHWQKLHQDTLRHLAPASGEAAFHLLRHHIYPVVLPKDGAGLDRSAARRKILASFHRATTGWGLARWDFRAAVDHQLTLIGRDTAAQDRFMADIFALHAENNVFTPDILAAQLARVGKDEKRLHAFIGSIGRTLSKGDSGSFEKVIQTLARAVLPDAAKRGDKATFQFIGKLTAKVYEPTAVKPDPFPGILLSSGGTFGIQKPGNRWDNPARHWGVIEEHGGDFHTDATPATATVQLGNFGRLSGVAIVTRNGWFGRLVGAKLQTSIDGKEWTTVHTFKKHAQVHRIDLTARNITAGYVRVIHEGQPSLHFHRFLVYGKKSN